MLGVYVHVPFCARRCDYCDFATWSDREHLVDEYVDACITDLRRRHPRPASSVFFGGGTPSLLPSDQLVRILDEIPRHPDAEVTVECNPDSVDEAKLRRYRQGGVTRISLGVQSTRPHVLAALGRTHDPVAAARAVALVRDSGVETFNVDVIYGAPGETPSDWRRTLDDVVAWDPPHVSAYALTVEPATPLGRHVADGLVAPPDDDLQADAYAAADDVLGAAGLAWYEISNWARPGHECRHNLATWAGGDYLAIGCAAHGHVDGERWWNVRTPERYVARIAAHRDPAAGRRRAGRADRAETEFALALRTRTGARVAGGDGDAVVSELVDGGVVARDGDRVRLTRPGRLLADDVTARLVLAGAHRGPRAAGTR